VRAGVPFDIPAAAVANSDGVRVAVDLLVTIRIVEPEKFVFAISAPDFDQVCRASGQDAIRPADPRTSTDDVLTCRTRQPTLSRPISASSQPVRRKDQRAVPRPARRVSVARGPPSGGGQREEETEIRRCAAGEQPAVDQRRSPHAGG
jgi:hypothetical protein